MKQWLPVGENSSIPHWKPSNRKIETGDPILIDMGCKYNGYCSDMSRTIFMGCILEEIKPIYNLVLKNQMNINKKMEDNSIIKSLANEVDNDFEFNKFKMIHALGHGIGLETHEIPFINSKSKCHLRENMVVTNEPRNIYTTKIRDKNRRHDSYYKKREYRIDKIWERIRCNMKPAVPDLLVP